MIYLTLKLTLNLDIRKKLLYIEEFEAFGAGEGI